MLTKQRKHFGWLIAMIAFAMMSFAPLSALAQDVKGVVTDAQGEPVIGATVQEQGTKNAVITDFDGNYTIKLSKKNASIVFSYIGMKSQTISAAGKSTINVKLEDEATALNDVVVIGYGSVRKKDITGSVATVNADALAVVPVASASEALQGKMAGVQISATEGSPDAEVKIRVRGGGSITQSNDPLYVVDGFPVESISDIPANEIEDITVLKDASSTAIYGSRGANGVILVTTKSGKSGKVNVSYNAYYSWKWNAKKLDVLSAYDYAKWQYELAMLKNNGDQSKISSYTDFFGNYDDMDLYQTCPTNDWQDITFGRTGKTFNHNINVTGGSDNIRYAASYAHMNDKAIMYGSYFQRDNISLKLNTKPTKKTTLDFQARYARVKVNGAGANEAAGAYDTDRRLKYAMIYTPIPLKNLDPTAGTDDDLGNLYNPIVSTNDNDQRKNRKNLNLSAAFGWEVYKNLKLKTEVGYDYYNNYNQRFWGTTAYYVKNVPPKDYQNMPAIRLVNSNRERLRNTNTLSYDFKKLITNKDHSLNVLLGHEYVITKQNTNSNEVHGFPVDYDADTAWRLTNQGGYKHEVSDIYSPDDKLLSYFGRANYNFKDKYLLSATFRADCSSKFAEGNRWGYFPSAAIAWRISAEPFMKGTEKWLDDLKLRLSFGTAGNNNIPTGQLVQEYSSGSTTWVNGFTTTWAPSKTMANPDLKWETTITRNLGLDFTLLGGRINGSIEGYINTTKDLLILFPTSGSGYDNQYRNMGKTQNTGLEITATWHAINKKNYGLDISANIGFNKNEIKDLGEMKDFGWNTGWASTEIGYDYKLAVGSQLGTIIGYKLDGNGRYEVSDFQGYDKANGWILKDGVVDNSNITGVRRPGTLKLKDVDGNGSIGEEDIVEIGKTSPVAFGGFTLSGRAYGFDLTANFNYSIGNDVYNANKIEYTSTGKYQYRNMIDVMADGKRWTNLNADGTLCTDMEQLAALNANTTMWSPYMSKMILTDWAIEDASFLRLNTLSLGYTVPQNITKKAGISSLRFYATVYNVFTITGYSGMDPEADCIRKTNLTPNCDYSGYPRSRSFTVGLNLNF